MFRVPELRTTFQSRRSWLISMLLFWQGLLCLLDLREEHPVSTFCGKHARHPIVISTRGQ